MEDAQEWMMGILGKLHDEFVEFKTRVPKARMGTVLKDAEYTSFMYRIFGGKLQTQVFTSHTHLTGDCAYLCFTFVLKVLHQLVGCLG